MTPFIARFLLIGAALPYNQLWYAVPLIVGISLVYGATRDEEMDLILYHAYRSAVMICTFLATMFALLWIISLFV